MSDNESIRSILREIVLDEPLNSCADDGISCMYCNGKLHAPIFGDHVFMHEKDCVLIRAREALDMSTDGRLL